MNYLTEILAFYKWLEQHPLSPVLQAYWHLLMYWNNRAAVLAEDNRWYWRVSFNVPNTSVMTALNLKNRQAVWKQRKTLMMTQRITYTPNAGRSAGTYALIPFDKGLEQIAVKDKEYHHLTQVWAQTMTEGLHNTQPYINTINNKPSILFYNTQERDKSTMGFNLLPQLTNQEKAAIKAQYPEDKVARFQAMWAAREKKAMENGE